MHGSSPAVSIESGDLKEQNMRLVILTVLSAVALGLLAVSGASAMPANGVAIDQAASAGQFAQPVWWRYRRWHRWHYHYWWRRW
jgi:hypothetical protein